MLSEAWGGLEKGVKSVLSPQVPEYKEPVAEKEALKGAIEGIQGQERYVPKDVQAATISDISQSQAAKDQAALVQALQAQMSAGGLTPQAQQGLNQATAQAIAAQRAMAAGRQGASNIRAAERNIAGQLQQQAGQSALMTEQQRQAALQQLAPILQQQIAGQQQQALNQAQLQQQAMLANQQAGLSAAGLGQQLDLGVLGALGGLYGQQSQTAAQQQQAAMQNQQARNQLIGSIIGSGAAAYAGA